MTKHIMADTGISERKISHTVGVKYQQLKLNQQTIKFWKCRYFSWFDFRQYYRCIHIVFKYVNLIILKDTLRKKKGHKPIEPTKI